MVYRGTQCCAYKCIKRRKAKKNDEDVRRSDSEGSEDGDSQRKRQFPRTFHRFPKDPEKKKSWAKNIRREGWFPSDYAQICSDHFFEDSINRTGKNVTLKANAEPKRFKHYPRHSEHQKRERRERKARPKRLLPEPEEVDEAPPEAEKVPLNVAKASRKAGEKEGRKAEIRERKPRSKRLLPESEDVDEAPPEAEKVPLNVAKVSRKAGEKEGRKAERRERKARPKRLLPEPEEVDEAPPEAEKVPSSVAKALSAKNLHLKIINSDHCYNYQSPKRLKEKCDAYVIKLNEFQKKLKHSIQQCRRLTVRNKSLQKVVKQLRVNNRLISAKYGEMVSQSY